MVKCEQAALSFRLHEWGELNYNFKHYFRFCRLPLLSFSQAQSLLPSSTSYLYSLKLDSLLCVSILCVARMTCEAGGIDATLIC